MSVKIYILERNGIPYYVGKTIQSLQERLYTHKGNRKNDSIIEIDNVDESEWEFWESHYIFLYRSWGFILENKNFGGGGRESGWESTTERNQKISQNRKGKGLGPNPKISEKNKGKSRPFTEDHRKNMEIAKRKQAKPILMYDLEGNFIKEWESKGQAANWLKEKTNSKAKNLVGQIKDCILGYQKTCYGYKFKFK
jgi:hypothetical protein